MRCTIGAASASAPARSSDWIVASTLSSGHLDELVAVDQQHPLTREGVEDAFQSSPLFLGHVHAFIGVPNLDAIFVTKREKGRVLFGRSVDDEMEAGYAEGQVMREPGVDDVPVGVDVADQAERTHEGSLLRGALGA